jgi:hypothetical protein
MIIGWILAIETEMGSVKENGARWAYVEKMCSGVQGLNPKWGW